MRFIARLLRLAPKTVRMRARIRRFAKPSAVAPITIQF